MAVSSVVFRGYKWSLADLERYAMDTTRAHSSLEAPQLAVQRLSEQMNINLTLIEAIINDQGEVEYYLSLQGCYREDIHFLAHVDDLPTPPDLPFPPNAGDITPAYGLHLALNAFIFKGMDVTGPKRRQEDRRRPLAAISRSDSSVLLELDKKAIDIVPQFFPDVWAVEGAGGVNGDKAYAARKKKYVRAK